MKIIGLEELLNVYSDAISRRGCEGPNIEIAAINDTHGESEQLRAGCPLCGNRSFAFAESGPTLDADFHTMLIVTGMSGPSVIRIRMEGLKGPAIVATTREICRVQASTSRMMAATAEYVRHGGGSGRLCCEEGLGRATRATRLCSCRRSFSLQASLRSFVDQFTEFLCHISLAVGLVQQVPPDVLGFAVGSGFKGVAGREQYLEMRVPGLRLLRQLPAAETSWHYNVREQDRDPFTKCFQLL